MKTKANLSIKQLIIVILLLIITLIADVCADPVSAVAVGGRSGGGRSGGVSGRGSGTGGGEAGGGSGGNTRMVPAGKGTNNNQPKKRNGAQLTKPPFILPGRHGFAWDTIISMFGLHLDAVIIFNLLVFFLI
ncbi:unnamed protein product [Cuscuta europaea]|uniref:Uncharacterized protein n=1 Tax=Cuscuta europaea TaxID=41803 RepID=A0A9P0ZEL0_CUSEU|nr:unnamed protein product [Cuscuta europaea]